MGFPGGYCSDGTKLCSIGLVRYSAAGLRGTWANPGSGGRNANQYVLYPAVPTNLRFQYLRDVKVRGNLIDVLVDVPESDGVVRAGYRNVQIVTFRDDGSWLGSRIVFGSWGLLNYSDDNQDFYGGQMVQMSSTRMIVVATAYGSTGSRIAATRMKILADGSLAEDGAWGQSYAEAGRVEYYLPFNPCGTSQCEITASYAFKPVNGGVFNQDDFYVTGSLRVAGGDWDVITARISSVSGTVQPEFNGGWVRTAFDQTNSNKNDLSAGLYVYQDEVYVAAQVARKCNNGIGVARINGATGGYIAAFGSGGKAVFGGQGNDAICFTNGTLAAVPSNISATGGRIGIVGYEYYKTFNFPSTLQADPMLAVVNAVPFSAPASVLA